MVAAASQICDTRYELVCNFRSFRATNNIIVDERMEAFTFSNFLRSKVHKLQIFGFCIFVCYRERWISSQEENLHIDGRMNAWTNRVWFSLSILFAVVMHKEKEENGLLSHMHHHDTYRSRELGAFEHGLSDGDMFLQVSFQNDFISNHQLNAPIIFNIHRVE